MNGFDQDRIHTRRQHQDDDVWIDGSQAWSLQSGAELSGLAVRGQTLLVTVEEAARLLGIGRTTMFELIGSGKVKSIRLGRRRLIARTSLESFVDGLSLA